MFEEFTNQAMAILSLTIGGVSVGSIIALAVYLIKQLIRNRREIAVTKTQIETAFKNAVLPKNIKLDISKKIEAPIKDGLTLISIAINERLERVAKGEELILAVLSQFSHMNKLPESVQNEIKDYLDVGVTENTILE